jgi:hypothetical protein
MDGCVLRLPLLDLRLMHSDGPTGLRSRPWMMSGVRQSQAALYAATEPCRERAWL